MIERTSVNQSPGGGTLYPFTSATVLNEAILDFYLSYEDSLCDYVFPISLTISGNTLSVRDALNVLIVSCDINDSNSTVWGTRTVHEWLGSTTVLRVVILSLVDGVGVLDPRTLDRMPGRVSSVRVGAQTFTGNIRFEAGYNITLSGSSTERVDGTRKVDAISMDAVPGAGMGRQPGCLEVEPLVRRINKIQPDDSGNFIIEMNDCFRNQLKVTMGVNELLESVASYATSSDKASIGLYSDCHPCYDCSYFVRTYRGVKHLWDQWKTIAQKAESVRDTYEANRERWTDQLECRLNHASRLVTMSEFSCKGFIGGLYCNFSSCCLAPVELRFTLQKYKAGTLQTWPTTGVQVVEAYVQGSNGEVGAAPLINGPVYSFLFDSARPQQTSLAKFRLCVHCTSDESLRVTFTVHTPDPPPVPLTGEVCVLPTVAAPDDIVSIWTDRGLTGSTVRALEQNTIPLNPAQPIFACQC